MTILKIHKKQNNFVILDKTCLHHAKISWAAKGLHAYLISLPDDWRIRVSDLQKRASNGRDAVRNILNELEQAGFIKKSRSRSEETGRFGAMEFLVLEYPFQEKTIDTPETEFQSVAEDAIKTPSPDNPSPVTPTPGNPSPDNPTLLNINRINNNKINIETAAAISKSSAENTTKENAAVIYSNNKIEVSQKQNVSLNTVQQLSIEDALIKNTLTPTQIQRVMTLVHNLQLEDNFQLSSEIQFCLLNPDNFTGCGKDFSKKLNAIRSVILRGDWQTPAGMLTVEEEKKPSQHNILEQALQSAWAEATHFHKLLTIAKPNATAQLAKLVSQAQLKIKDIEEQLGALILTTDNVIPLTH